MHLHPSSLVTTNLQAHQMSAFLVAANPANSPRRDIGRATSVAGIGVAERRIGSKEMETRIDAPINSVAVPASPSVNRPCAPMMPKVYAIMYDASTLPRVPFVEASFNQLSAVT